MDRLSLVSRWAVVLVAALLLVAGCDESSDAPAESARSRVVAVKGDDSNPDLDAFCDVRPDPGEAPRLELPPVEGKPPSPPEQRWRWLNVWATWCKPCVEEIPRLLKWKDDLAEDGSPVQLVFMSVDESSKAVASFREEHPEIPDSLRVKDQEALESWITGLGMDPGATIPLQVYADGQQRVRCVRSGAVRSSDYEAVHRLLSMGS